MKEILLSKLILTQLTSFFILSILIF